MLRSALPLTRRIALQSVRQPTRAPAISIRFYADKPSIRDPRPPVLPGSESTTQTVTTPAPPGAVQPGEPTPVVANPIAQTPPPPVATSASSTPPPTTLPPTDAIKQSGAPPKKPRRRFRNFLLTLILLGGLGFGGGVWYSSISDNFHDFFTEYIPFGEQAVLYFEEREFRKRFPARKHESSHLPSNGDEKVTIPSKSGLSWRLSGEDDKSNVPKGALSAVDSGKPGKSPSAALQAPSSTTGKEKQAAVARAKDDATQGSKKTSGAESKPAPRPTQAATPAPTTAPVKASAAGTKSPEVNEPSVWVPVGHIDPLAVKDADEPLVQDLAKILNDIILVADADNSTGKFSGAMGKAKSQLEILGQRIKEIKNAERQAADEKTKASEIQFDNAAKELVQRLEAEMKEQEAHFKQEFEQERSRLQSTFETQLKTESDHASKLADEKLQNELLEQAIALKKEFTSSVRQHVEDERNGRLSKLTELNSSVDELRKLTGEWNKVLESNLSTQHLLNAVEAVKASLESADRPRPFVRELAALSEIAGKNEVVDAALEGISPAAYTYGIATPPQLIERFRRVADEVRKAALLPENAGMASHATSFVLSKVMFKKEGSVQGTDVESLLFRTEMLLEEGRLDDAAREVNGLTGWAKSLSKDWLGEVRRVLEVRQALQIIETEARLQALKVD